MTNEELSQQKVGEMVASDYRYADVFKKYGIDFCCGGGKSIERVCSEKNVPLNELLEQLQMRATNGGVNSNEDFVHWPLDKLVSYIEFTHHTYVNENLGLIAQYAAKVEKAHGQHNPEVIEIARLWNELSAELSVHMKKEELMLFPYIKRLWARSIDSKIANITAHFGTVNNPIRVMISEHETAGELMERIAVLSNNYTPPQHACNTYRVLYAKLKEFENDLHKHVHLENNILFPKAIDLEEAIV